MDLSDFVGVEEQVPREVRKMAKKASVSILPGRDEVGDDIHWGGTGAIDHVLQGRTIDGAENSILQQLTDQAREAESLQLPVTAGTRVSFSHNVGAVLAYEDIPDKGVDGTVILIRSATGGDLTASESGVHVLWDDGQFRAIRAEHLRQSGVNQKRASLVRMSFIEFGGISNLFELAKTGSTDLVHKATKDLWSFREQDGEFVIERLFADDGSPLKV